MSLPCHLVPTPRVLPCPPHPQNIPHHLTSPPCPSVSPLSLRASVSPSDGDGGLSWDRQSFRGSPLLLGGTRWSWGAGGASGRVWDPPFGVISGNSFLIRRDLGRELEGASGGAERGADRCPAGGKAPGALQIPTPGPQIPGLDSQAAGAAPSPCPACAALVPGKSGLEPPTELPQMDWHLSDPPELT